MEFEQLHQDTDCDCLKDAKENYENYFARKINKPEPKDSDFKSHWERGKRAEGCVQICGFKGISVNEWNENTKNDVIQKFLITFRITPKHKDSMLIFKYLEQSGLLFYSPNKNDNSHFDFYKSDTFSLDLIEQTECISLREML